MLRLRLSALLGVLALTACHVRAQPSSPATLAAFRSEAELARYLRELAAANRAAYATDAAAFSAKGDSPASAASAMPAPVAAPMAAPMAARSDRALRRSGASLTNVQHEGVDEGDIVKPHGDHLVILRRGRLFTVAVGGGVLRPAAAVDAFGPGIDPSSAWYDELLVSRDRVVVIGYSYARGGTEVGVFDIDGAGGLRHRATYQLRSNDYYSSRNYASRLVGTTLIFYSPLALTPDERDPLAALPAMREWHDSASRFRPIAAARRVYRPARPLPPGTPLALHTVTACDLAAPEMRCAATVVIGPRERVFYVSPGAVYVWANDPARRAWGRRPADEFDDDAFDGSRATLYRLPLDGSTPRALGVAGSPIDQFSFLEGEDGYLNVLVNREGRGDAMWNAESRRSGGAALLRVPVASFGDGQASAPPVRYRPLPAPNGIAHDRFVGAHLLYGAGNGWGWPRAAERSDTRVYVVPLDGGPVVALALPHTVDRIEAMGEDAVVVGTLGTDLHFTAVRLGPSPVVAQHYALAGASQGELRSHGFFYREDGIGSGVLGLPVSGAGRPGYAHLFRGSAAVLFLRNAGGAFADLGTLDAGAGRAADDACRASCVDWYGNARPLFLGDRVLALLGYELVEGRLRGGRVEEVARVSFAPRLTAAVRGRP